MCISENAEQALRAFLCEYFDALEVSHLARGVLLDAPLLCHKLPPPSTSIYTMVDAFLDLAKRHGYIDDQFFEALCAARPRLKDKIRNIKTCLPSADPGKHERPAKSRVRIHLDIELESLSDESIKEILAILRSLSGDSRMTIESVSRGSTILVLLGEERAIRRLGMLLRTKQIAAMDNIPVIGYEAVAPALSPLRGSGSTEQHLASPSHSGIRRRIERALRVCLDHAAAPPCPPRLAQALRYAVFPGGARFRPTLCLTVATACGDAHPVLAEAAAVAIELLHCASLVYNDLPCFDDAAVRRSSSPSVHVAFGEELAILAGNTLIVQAFDSLARAAISHTLLLPSLMRVIARGVGTPSGIAASKAWESEPHADHGTYHRARAGALFESAVIAGALAGGGDPLQWTGLGHRLGEAYQVADDLRNALGSADILGKSLGSTERAHLSAVRELGHAGALARLDALCEEVVARIPACAGRHDLIDFIHRWQTSYHQGGTGDTGSVFQAG